MRCKGSRVVEGEKESWDSRQTAGRVPEDPKSHGGRQLQERVTVGRGFAGTAKGYLSNLDSTLRPGKPGLPQILAHHLRSYDGRQCWHYHRTCGMHPITM